MKLRTRSWAWAVLVTVTNSALAMPSTAQIATDQSAPTAFRGAMLAPVSVTDQRLAVLQADGIRAVALQLETGVNSRERIRRASALIANHQFDLYYWAEVARCRQLADTHPEWMASLQGHKEWRRLFDDPPRPSPDEVVKTYPWVPILNKEPFHAQVERVRALLTDLPIAKGLFLNDLQGAPSACGCGNHLCRWTSDYGEIRTATPLGNEAPGNFIAAIQSLFPKLDIIPVWTTECEEHDGDPQGLCAGVGCFQGICWKAYTEQLMPVAERSNTLAVLLPYRAFQRDLNIYGPPAGWIDHAVTSFQTMPVRHQGSAIAASRLITVLQGWDVTERQINDQIIASRRAGSAGYLIAYASIDQDWTPKIVNWKQRTKSASGPPREGSLNQSAHLP